MVLNNTEIRELIGSDAHMIENHDDSCIINSSYKIRIGDIVEPETGDLIDSNRYQLRPTKTILFRSKEKIHLPQNITASYSALYSISSIGILLINASMIGPGYNGYLSGMLLNFSAKKFKVKKDMEVARITFFKQTEDTEPTIPDEDAACQDDDEYLDDLKKKAENNYHSSFMDIDNFSKSVGQKVFNKIKNSFYVMIAIAGFLVVFAEVEPFIQGWAFRTTGIIGMHEVVEAKSETLLNELKIENAELRKEIHELKDQLRDGLIENEESSSRKPQDINKK